jgi:hypothetical protein
MSQALLSAKYMKSGKRHSMGDAAGTTDVASA